MDGEVVTMSRRRLYRLYSLTREAAYLTTTPGDGWQEDYQTRWKFTVRAHSLKQAKYLAGNDIWAVDSSEVGIVEIRPPTLDQVDAWFP